MVMKKEQTCVVRKVHLGKRGSLFCCLKLVMMCCVVISLVQLEIGLWEFHVVFFVFLRVDDLEVTLAGATKLARLSTQRISEVTEPSDVADFEFKGEPVEAFFF